jgi:tRNA1Val (adenine37-N6)-methyltransferase
MQDFKSFETEDKFDLIVSNPPYFEVRDSEKDKIARQTVELNFRQLISQSARLLSENGVFSVIIPVEAGSDFIRLQRKINCS